MKNESKPDQLHKESSNVDYLCQRKDVEKNLGKTEQPKNVKITSTLVPRIMRITFTTPNEPHL